MKERIEKAVNSGTNPLAQDATQHPPTGSTEFDDPVVPKWRLILLSLRYFPKVFP
jgi:hypothetical protein